MKNNLYDYLKEDIGSGDVTTNSIVPKGHTSKARIIAKEDGVIAGNTFAAGVFMLLDNQLLYEEVVHDGERVKKGDVIAIVKGKTRAILSGERVALNILQRLSGIATLTRQFVDAVEDTETKILDTRKTSPGHRIAEKYAVRMGSGVNHRSDLSEMALIKENHIAVAGSIKEAIKRVHANSKVPVEVEVKNMAELMQALEENVDRILLDNWNIESTREAVSYTNKRVPLEASGNMTLESVTGVAKTGVDFISIGALTHSFKSLDISLLHEGV
ncbi:MAG: carboxylating nicotinate-nucleotide diphosphorylase [Proteobacteria bacterium]|nr:carboxylating nicotinate-nucleotide diphosphorylase [Pseudomonadota bacterium]